MVVWPMIAMMVEVLPAPFGPSSASVDALGEIEAEIHARRGSEPYPQLRCSSRSMIARLSDIGFAHGLVGHHVAFGAPSAMMRPPSSTTRRRHTRSTSPRLCSIRMVVMPVAH